MKRTFSCILLTLVLTMASIAQQTGPAARVVAWEPKPGMERDFEEGYKRHLQWHKTNADTWIWHGWKIITGDRTGFFVDGSFFHLWNDLDRPLRPAEDSADNVLNVEPYATVRHLAVVESLPALSNVTQQDLASPLMTFLRIEVQPGTDAQFESAMARSLQSRQLADWRRLVLRSASGSTEYMFMLPASRQSDLAVQQQRTTEFLRDVRDAMGSSSLIVSVRNELGRYRSDLSYLPQ